MRVNTFVCARIRRIMGEAARVYAEQLGSLSLGHPLWFPNPTATGEVQIGDVGFLEDGSFHRLFNVMVEPDHEWNRLGPPPDFTPVKIPTHLRHHMEEYMHPGIHSSSSVRVCSISPELSECVNFV